MLINAKDTINTRKCYLIDVIRDSKDYKEDGLTVDSKRIDVEEIEFMDLKDGDLFILHEEDGTLVTWDNGRSMISKALGEPYYKNYNGNRIKSVNTDEYEFKYENFSIAIKKETV